MIPLIHFTVHDLEKAEAHNTYIHEKRKNSPQCHYSNGIANTNKRGYLGELAFAKYLEACNISYFQHPLETKCGGDDYDFIVFDQKIDVKSSTRYDYIFINDEAASRCIDNDFILVHVKLDPAFKYALLLGYQNACALRRCEEKDHVKAGKLRRMYEIPRSALIEFTNKDYRGDLW